jgi:hypothetical protein
MSRAAENAEMVRLMDGSVVLGKCHSRPPGMLQLGGRYNRRAYPGVCKTIRNPSVVDGGTKCCVI